MNQQDETNAAPYQIGMWAALLLTIETIVFGVALLIPGALNVAFGASVLIAPTFVTVMIALHHITPSRKQVWSHLGIAFAVIYSVYGTLNYYIQLTVVRTNSLGASPDLLRMFTFTPGSVMFAQDMLGYTFLALTTLVAAPVFSRSRLARWIKTLFVVHGLTFFVPLVFPALSLPQDSTGDEFGMLANLLWCILFAPLSLMLITHFRRGRS